MATAVNSDLNDNDCNQNNLSTSLNETNKTIAYNGNCKDPQDEFLATGFTVDELYALSTTFLKEKEGKAFHISYKDKLSLVAFSKQVKNGKFIEEKSAPVGYLDVIGRDRRQAWQALGDMSEKSAKAGFISLLNNICPLFHPFVMAHKCDLEEKERRRLAEEERKRKEAEEEEQMRLEEEKFRSEEEARLKQEKERIKQNQQKELCERSAGRFDNGSKLHQIDVMENENLLPYKRILIWCPGFYANDLELFKLHLDNREKVKEFLL
ncbi:golgi resident protein GCP60 [Caerostris extrusa]|uniref:Golgi resident protein GCP60 n=1 Tax=Caerostris extrusa TaxID=172846 RepID=A0AAV4NI80_CAEEX|nr:golgi resident protein GCP60 [Caerostris extrusa]